MDTDDGHAMHHERVASCDLAAYESRKGFKYDEVSQIGDRVYSDIAGPFPSSLLGGKKYVISFTDAFSRYAICYFLESKDQAPIAMDECIKYYAMYNKRIKCLVTDNGGEYGGHRESQPSQFHVQPESEAPWQRETVFSGILAENSIQHVLIPTHSQ